MLNSDVHLHAKKCHTIPNTAENELKQMLEHTTIFCNPVAPLHFPISDFRTRLFLDISNSHWHFSSFRWRNQAER